MGIQRPKFLYKIVIIFTKYIHETHCVPVLNTAIAVEKKKKRDSIKSKRSNLIAAATERLPFDEFFWHPM